MFPGKRAAPKAREGDQLEHVEANPSAWPPSPAEGGKTQRTASDPELMAPRADEGEALEGDQRDAIPTVLHTCS